MFLYVLYFGGVDVVWDGYDLWLFCRGLYLGDFWVGVGCCVVVGGV